MWGVSGTWRKLAVRRDPLYRGGMHVDERVVGTTGPAGGDDVGWFAARQPGMIGFLEQRLGSGRGPDRDAFAVALEAARFIGATFQRQLGMLPPRVPRALLDRAEQALAGAGEPADGCAARQPALTAWVAQLVASPPVPLGRDEARAVGLALAAIIYALDELTTGRPVP
jgi:hypothetical protein